MVAVRSFRQPNAVMDTRRVPPLLSISYLASELRYTMFSVSPHSLFWIYSIIRYHNRFSGIHTEATHFVWTQQYINEGHAIKYHPRSNWNETDIIRTNVDASRKDVCVTIKNELLLKRSKFSRNSMPEFCFEIKMFAHYLTWSHYNFDVSTNLLQQSRNIGQKGGGGCCGETHRTTLGHSIIFEGRLAFI